MSREQEIANLRRRLAEVRSNSRPVTPVTKRVARELCGDRCIRAAGHTGLHLPPLDPAEETP